MSVDPIEGGIANAVGQLFLAGLIAASVVGCSTTPVAPATSTPSLGVALGVGSSASARPIEGAEIEPDSPARFPDLLPGVLDVEVTVTEPPVFPFSGPGVVYLAGNPDFTNDVVTFLAADDVLLAGDPFHEPQSPDPADVSEQLVAVAPGQLLDRLADLPFLEITVPRRALSVAGLDSAAVDVRVADLPADTKQCEIAGPVCAVLLVANGFAQSVVAGQELRLVELDLPAGRILIVQNLQDPRAQALLDGARYVEHTLAPVLNPARPMTYSAGPLAPDQLFGAELTTAGIGVSFRTGRDPSIGYVRDGTNVTVISADLAPDLLAPAPFGYQASTEKLYGYVAPTEDLMVPPPGVDPRLIGPAAFGDSTSMKDSSSGGLVDLIAAQTWADITAPPTDTTLAGLPARSIEVRLRPGTGSVPCTLSAPQDGSCAVLVYSRAIPSIWLLADRILRITDVVVGGVHVTVISSTDESGQIFADSLRLIDLEP